ncbi:MAG: DUF58 domain-containing protein [Planctomycetes bacterium]|nr:DUF58 domain-containing protein [Planctomycetota bacterium]
MSTLGAALGRRVGEAGAIAVGLALIALFFAWVYAVPALWLLGFFVLALSALDALYAARVLRKVELRRTAPSRARADWPFEIVLELRNTHLLAPLSGVLVRDALLGQAAAVSWAVFPWIGAGETRRVSTRLTARRRGLHRFEASLVRTGFPLGLWSAQLQRLEPAEVLVHPRAGRIAEALFRRLEQLESTRRAKQATRSDEEFRGLREWRHGDNPKRIHWRRSARLGALVVKEFEETRTARLSLVLCTVADRGKSAALAEEAISFSAALARACQRRGLALSLICGPSAAPEVLELGRGRFPLERALDRLAQLVLEPRADPQAASALAALSPRLFRERHVLCVAPHAATLPSEEQRARWRKLGAEVWSLPADGREFARYFSRATPMERLETARSASRSPLGAPLS